jgi:LysR family transcriptional regulator, glycine cleavage system transcriptional activator
VRLPSLNALRAFEAAARHQSFARAADELHVTQGAVSRHVRLLEEELETVLFRRHARGIELTAQGRSLLPELTASFERIARAARRAAEGDRELRVASPPTLAARWLVRRLAGFRDLRPELRVTLGVTAPTTTSSGAASTWASPTTTWTWTGPPGWRRSCSGGRR